MSKIVAKIAYDGTNYHGWQRQKREKSLQEEIERALSIIYKKKISVLSAGRTDRGVHARGQIICFKSNSKIKIPLKNLKLALNTILDKNIRILKLSSASNDFHPRFSAIKRKYKYYIINKENFYPWQIKYAYYVRERLDLDNLNFMAKKLIGIHDFSSFSSSKDKSHSKIREIYESNFKKKNGFIIFEIIGSSFLWTMVRSIVGTIIDIERKKEDVNLFNKIFKAKERSLVRKLAPGNALFLEKVYYEKNII